MDIKAMIVARAPKMECRACYMLSHKPCSICKKTRKQYDPRIVQRIQELRDIYLRCRAFKQESCGFPAIDIQIKALWGDWK